MLLARVKEGPFGCGLTDDVGSALRMTFCAEFGPAHWNLMQPQISGTLSFKRALKSLQCSAPNFAAALSMSFDSS